MVKPSVFRCASEVPALYKIFDEILVNAADNLQRDPQEWAGAAGVLCFLNYREIMGFSTVNCG